MLFIVDSFSDFFVNFDMQKSIKALSKSSPPKYELPYANLTLHVMESLFFVNSKSVISKVPPPKSITTIYLSVFSFELCA